jgi:predicted cupin superfamily sugar epimerase
VTADDFVRLLDLNPHPEGGHFRETYRDDGHPRGASTAIYYLLKAGERSHWHRVDAAEVWHWYAGDPLELSISEADTIKAHTLGPNLTAGERPQVVVPKLAWQSARTLGRYTLVGCTVAPAFTFEGFEMAPPDWRPG